MKVLTFGWDFPPQTTGGLGMACQGLMRELTDKGVEVIFVLPKKQLVQGSGRFIFANISDALQIPDNAYAIGPYNSSQTFYSVRGRDGKVLTYSHKLIEAVHEFAKQAGVIAKREEFDLIHAHDWTSYLAGLAAKRISGKPLIVHVHATAYDQAAGDNVDPDIYAIERETYALADSIMTVSEFTRKVVIERYGADPAKVSVVHNGMDDDEPVRYEPTLTELKAQGKKIVLYHGRITVQKGVDYFVSAARKVIDYDPNVVFVISGKGDMEAQIMHQVAALGLSQYVRFAGALWYEERDQMYQSVDLIVMPSVSEPFGLVPLEAMRHGTPAIISKQSGVSEVITHVLKVDFWDVDEMANQILATLRYPVMRQQLINEGRQEIKRLSWRRAAEKVRDIYQRLLHWVNVKTA
jgi:glycosyltransferase involved in cell wall biosynthesis